MTDLFDGLATLLVEAFGDTHRHTSSSGAVRDIQGVFRAEPVEVLDGDQGAVLMVSPSLKVLKDVAADIRADDTIRASGTNYTVLNKVASGSPADDGFLYLELEESE